MLILLQFNVCFNSLRSGLLVSTKNHDEYVIVDSSKFEAVESLLCASPEVERAVVGLSAFCMTS
jgi:hypothetical protein